MTQIKFFKLQAKNFMRDFETQKKREDGTYEYTPRFFSDIDDIIICHNIDEDKFTLMNAQHVVAIIAGFKSWNDLIHASESRLELGKLLFEHREEDLLLDKWKNLETLYLSHMDDEAKLDIFKHTFLEKH